MELSQISKEAEFEVIKQKIKKNQKDWTEHFNQKGMKMISAPDIYRIAKEDHKELIERLKEDFSDNYYLVTSTRIKYSKDNLDAEIIHDADSIVVKPKSVNVKVYVYSGEVYVYSGEKTREDAETEAYLQALFDTKDSLSYIISVLKRFDNKKPLYLWTPSQSSRAIKQIRSVGLGFSVLDGFFVDGVGWFDGSVGWSRGVNVAGKGSDAK